MRKIWLFALALLMITSQVRMLRAVEGTYYLYNSKEDSFELIEEFMDFNSAYSAYRERLDEFENLVLVDNDRVIAMEFGIVEFNTNDGCTLTLDYLDSEGDSKVLNGCYAIDAAYLYSSEDLNTVYFMLSGDRGAISLDDVILHPYETLDVALSKYSIRDGYLYHDIKSQLELDYVYSSIRLDEALDCLNDGEYYSYDGIYFYDNFYTMIRDYSSYTYENALNYNSPYFNYYLYLPHRTMTSYNYEDIASYLYDEMLLDKRLDNYYDFNFDNANDEVNRSQYVGNVESFFENQYLYGANALLTLSISIEESSYGKSYTAYSKNNLFRYAAYDTREEINNERYLNVAKSIYAHAKYYISSRFANPNSLVYNGSFLGNKLSGMNVSYASDPYWGEKCASNYYSIDEDLGFKDKNTYALGIISSGDVIFYEDATLSTEKYLIDDVHNYSLVLLEEGNNYYKVQFDRASDSDDYRYDYKNDIAYINKELIDYVLNEEMISEPIYYDISFDLDNGTTYVFKVKEGDKPIVATPSKNSYEFVSFDKEIVEAYEDSTYKALYRSVVSIKLTNLPESVVLPNSALSLKGATLEVLYRDGLSTYREIKEVNTDMLKSYDFSNYGKVNVTIRYAGYEASFKVEVSEELYKQYQYLKENLPKIVERFKSGDIISLDEVYTIKESVLNTNYILSNEEIAILDKILLDEYRNDVNFNIDSPLNMSISGTALSVDEIKDSYENGFKLYEDTFYLNYKLVSLANRRRLETIASAYGFEDVITFALEFKRNSVTVASSMPFIVNIYLNDIDTSKIYSVYYISDDGDVIKLRTTQSADSIEFTAIAEGDFIILTRDSTNDYAIESQISYNLTKENHDIDINNIIIVALWLVILNLLGIILVVIYRKKNDEKEKVWRDYKKSWLSVVLPQEESLKN